jgi:hypothetical protein
VDERTQRPAVTTPRVYWTVAWGGALVGASAGLAVWTRVVLWSHRAHETPVGGAGLLLVVALAFSTAGVLAGLVIETASRLAARLSGREVVAAAGRAAAWILVVYLAVHERRVDVPLAPTDSDPTSLAWAALALTFAVTLLALGTRPVLVGRPPPRGRGRLGVLTLAGLAGAALLACLAWHAAGRGRTTGPSGPAAVRARPTGLRVLLVGFDGMDWKVAGPLVDSGRMPHLASLLERGTRASLSTLRPTHSRRIWTSIATGRRTASRGREELTGRQLVLAPGLDLTTVTIPPVWSLTILLRALDRIGLLRDVDVDSDVRRAPALWNLLTEAGMRSQVVGWFGAWPAEEITGFFVTRRIYPWRLPEEPTVAGSGARLTHPPELLERVRPLVVVPADVTDDTARRFFDVTHEELEAAKAAPLLHHDLISEFASCWSQAESLRRIALSLLEQDDTWDLHATYSLPTDLVGHCAMRYVGIGSPEEPEAAALRRRFGHAVEETYAWADEVLGDLLAHADERTVVVVVSDHGFDGQPGEPYRHVFAPPGVLVAAGPAIVHRQLAKASVLDVAPTVLNLLGLPVADDLEGVVLEGMLSPEFRAAHPVRRVPTYPWDGAD